MLEPADMPDIPKDKQSTRDVPCSELVEKVALLEFSEHKLWNVLHVEPLSREHQTRGMIRVYNYLKIEE